MLLVVVALVLAPLAILVNARTTVFRPLDSHVKYSSQDDWQPVGTAIRSDKAGATVTIQFADPNHATKRNNSTHVNQENGKRRGSSILAAFQRRPSSLLPWNTAPREPLPPLPATLDGSTHGGLGSSFRGNAVAPVIVGSQTWQSKLARAASWRRKTERLAETRKFYQLGEPSRTRFGYGKGDTLGPPPAVPLPEPPRDGEREMEERWRVQDPTLDVDRHYQPAVEKHIYATVASLHANNDVRCEQAYGQALSTGTHETEISSIRAASPTSTSHPGGHLRRRSNPVSPATAKHRFSKPLPSSPLHEPEPFYQNPFTLTQSATESNDSSSRISSSDVENARIARAAIRGIGASQANVPLHPESITSTNGQGINEGKASGKDFLQGTVMVERKPSLTRIINGRIAVTTDPVLGTTTTTTTRGRHKSLAGLIDHVGQQGIKPKRRRDRSPGEEDRPDFWVKRDTLPKYSLTKGDPRR
ncbi:uncharacterized protein JCM15063_000799 [Sporobolomyces koalae]|uniref:uncharacterized protein n=1 Tax=Sporobolomyces koalae TaxID=500713 RepID=UPI00317E9974